jgi:hypothetical protein
MVYGNTTDGSPLRSMIVHTYELIEGPYLAAAMLDDSTTLPQSFLADLVEGLITTSPRIRSSEKEYEKIDMLHREWNQALRGRIRYLKLALDPRTPDQSHQEIARDGDLASSSAHGA